MGESQDEYEYEQGPKKGDTIYLGARRVSGNMTKCVIIPNSTVKANGIMKDELFDVTLVRKGIRLNPIRRSGSPLLKKKIEPIENV